MWELLNIRPPDFPAVGLVDFNVCLLFYCFSCLCASCMSLFFNLVGLVPYLGSLVSQT